MITMSLWRTRDTPFRFYLLPDNCAIAPGEVQLDGPGGRHQHLCSTGLEPFAIEESQALRWAQAELSDTLDELREGLNDRLDELRGAIAEQRHAPVAPDMPCTPEVGPALLQLIRRLPSVIAGSLANDPTRLASARAGMHALQRQLEDAGIALDERAGDFPDRLARLRDEFEQARAAGRKPPRQS
jgi:hypothetical protein